MFVHLSNSNTVDNMSQVVQPVPNPNFSVKPLTTIAPSIVSRRQIKVPVNNPGTYGHNRSSLQSEATWDIADNECMVDLANIVLVADITGLWSDDYISPLLDAGVSGLIARLTIGTSQGLKIEEIQGYSQFSSIVQSYTMDAQRSERALLDGTNFITAFDKEKGANTFLDSPGAYQGNCYIDPKYPQRLHIKFHHSSFMQNMRYLPLFLLRNGIRISVEFENVYKAFNYSISPSIQSMEKIPMNESAPRYSINTLTHGAGELNWFVSSGTQTLDGTAIAPVEANDATTIFQPNMTTKLHKTNAIYGMRAVHTIWFPRTLAKKIYAKLVGEFLPPAGTITDAVNGHIVHRQNCVPFYIREEGINTYYGLITACKIDYAQADFLPAADATNIDNDAARFAGTFDAPTAQANSTIIVTAREFTDATKRFAYWTTATSQAGKEIWVPFNIEVPADTLPYWRSVSNLAAFNRQFHFQSNAEVEMLIDWNSRFSVYNNTTYGGTLAGFRDIPKALRKLPIHPQIAAKLIPHLKTTGWDYQLKNLELLMDLVKPSAADFGKYMQAFQAPSGIPIAFKRILYMSKEISSTTAGQVQFTLPTSVRSMLGCMIVLTDQMLGQDSSDWTKSTYPMLSSFMRRGLTRAELVIGGQVFPVYPMYARRPTDNSENTLAQILEVERFFGVKSSMGFNPSFSQDALRDTRNYLLAGSFDRTSVNLDDSTGTSLALNQYSAQSSQNTASGVYSTQTVAQTPSIVDASKFILAWSIAKDDVASFATGIDTSQSGTVVVNLYFDDTDPWAWYQRKIQAHFHILCDAVCTFQSAANLVRY